MAETQEATLTSLQEQKAELQKQRDALAESVASLTELHTQSAKDLERHNEVGEFLSLSLWGG